MRYCLCVSVGVRGSALSQRVRSARVGNRPLVSLHHQHSGRAASLWRGSPKPQDSVSKDTFSQSDSITDASLKGHDPLQTASSSSFCCSVAVTGVWDVAVRIWLAVWIRPSVTRMKSPPKLRTVSCCALMTAWCPGGVNGAPVQQ